MLGGANFRPESGCIHWGGDPTHPARISQNDDNALEFRCQTTTQTTITTATTQTTVTTNTIAAQLGRMSSVVQTHSSPTPRP